MIEGYSKEKCARRNRIVATRGTIDAVPLKFGTREALVGVSSRLSDAVGRLPLSDSEALNWINATRPAGSPELLAEDVYIHFAEAANTNFISDRYAFMAPSTLKNIALGGESGVAFMNSHRTGGFSTESELPFGRTFCGTYFEPEPGQGAAVLGFYMLRGIQPNGANGPTTDVLHRMIDGGQLFDVSVGLYPGTDGKAVCNVCGGDYNREESCPHFAGTCDGMTDEQKQAAVDIGVPSGACSYRLEGYQLGELSGVYDGAVPGAGFSKGFAMLDSLSEETKAQFREAFHRLMEVDPKESAMGGISAGKDMDNDKKPTIKERFLAFLFGDDASDAAIEAALKQGEELAKKKPVEVAAGPTQAEKAAIETATVLFVSSAVAPLPPALRTSKDDIVSPGELLARAAFAADGNKPGPVCEAVGKIFAETAKVAEAMKLPDGPFAQPSGSNKTDKAAKAQAVLAGAVKAYN